MRILIAEDEPVSRHVLLSILKKEGHEVLEARNGAEALAAFDLPDPPFVAVLDWMMPEIDGVEVCRRLRARKDLPPVYVILLTAKSQPENIVEGLRCGADDYMIKPFERRELAARIGVAARVVGLQRSLAERNRELASALESLRAAQARILLQERMAAIGTLAAGLSHEINNPTGFISGNLQLLAADLQALEDLFKAYESLEAEARERESLALRDVERIKGSVSLDRLRSEFPARIGDALEGIRRITAVIRTLAGYARSDGRPQELDLDREVEATLKFVTPDLQSRVRLSADLKADRRVHGRPEELKHAVLSLLVHSIRSVEAGGEVRVKTFPREDRALIEVSNDGPALSAEDRSRLFDPLSSSLEIQGGSGLGLYATYTVVQRYGGTLEVRSGPGRGTTFTISLQAAGINAARDPRAGGTNRILG